MLVASDTAVLSARLPETIKFPCEIVVVPVYEFAPDNVHVPVPFLVRVPVVVAMMLANEFPVAVPSSVNAYVPVMLPALSNIMFPEFALIVAAPPKVIKPLKVVAVPLEFVRAPADPYPIPLKVKGSVTSKV